MVHYMRLDYSTKSFFDINERSVASQQRHFAVKCMEEESITTVKKHVVKWIWDLPEAVQTALCLCAKEYLATMKYVALCKKRFDMSATSKQDALKRSIVSRDRPFLGLLDNFSEALVAAVQNVTEALKLVQEHVEAVDLHHDVTEKRNGVEKVRHVPMGRSLVYGISRRVCRV